MNLPIALALAAFAVAASPAHASEAVTPIAPAAARIGACRIVSPNFELKDHAQRAEDAHFLGGAKLSRPVATPCPHNTHAVEV